MKTETIIIFIIFLLKKKIITLQLRNTGNAIRFNPTFFLCFHFKYIV